MHQEVDKTFAFWGTKEGDIYHPAECMHELLEKVRRHKVNIDGNVCTVMVTTLVLEVINSSNLYQQSSFLRILLCVGLLGAFLIID